MNNMVLCRDRSWMTVTAIVALLGVLIFCGALVACIVFQARREEARAKALRESRNQLLEEYAEIKKVSYFSIKLLKGTSVSNSL